MYKVNKKQKRMVKMNYKKIRVYLENKNVTAVGILVDGNPNAIFVYNENNPTFMYAVSGHGLDIEFLEDDSKILGKNLNLLIKYCDAYYDLKELRNWKRAFNTSVSLLKQDFDVVSMDVLLNKLVKFSDKSVDYFETMDDIKIIKKEIKDLQKDFVELNRHKRNYTWDDIINRLRDGIEQAGVEMRIDGNKVSVNVNFNKSLMISVISVIASDFNSGFTTKLDHSFLVKGTDKNTSGNIRLFTEISDTLTFEDAEYLNNHIKHTVEVVREYLNV